MKRISYILGWIHGKFISINPIIVKEYREGFSNGCKK